MSSPETSPIPSECQPRPKPSQPLYLRLYFQSHMTDIVRLFGYGELPFDEARERIKPLIDKYGKDRILAAVEEIVEVDATREPQIARLTEQARRLSVQILGSPREDGDGGPQPQPERAEPVAAIPELETGDPDQTNRSAERKVQLPRPQVLARFEESLRQTQHQFLTADQARGSLPPEDARLGTLDFVVYEEGTNWLVAVRPHLRAKQKADMRKWQALFGEGFQSVRVWPVEASDGWAWKQHPIEPEVRDAGA